MLQSDINFSPVKTQEDASTEDQVKEESAGRNSLKVSDNSEELPVMVEKAQKVKSEYQVSNNHLAEFISAEDQVKDEHFEPGKKKYYVTKVLVKYIRTRSNRNQS